MKERADSSCEADASTAQDCALQNAVPTAQDWKELAERRLARLVEAEHDASVSRDRLDLLQSERRELLSERRELCLVNVNQLQRIQMLEREVATMLASRSWRWTAALRRFTTQLSRAKVFVVRVARKVVKLPVVRPIVRVSVLLLPGLSARLHARLYAHKH